MESRKIAVLEEKVENNQNQLDKIENFTKEMQTVIYQIKSRLDSWNGAIPHLAEDVKEILSQQKVIVASLTEEKIKNAKSEVKVKVMWGMIATLGGALASVLVKFVLKI